MFIPMTMTQEEAQDEIKRGSVSIEAIAEIEKILCRESLTPLQAQAVLTAAWNWMMNNGRIKGWTKN